MDWSGCSKGAMRAACIAAEQDDYVSLARILKVGISPFSE
jgi:hydroxyethylthiazole kinase-like sugar kinase family protein